MTENNRVEYKRELTDSLEREVVAFLNAGEGGTVYIGMDRDGGIYGVDACDQIQLVIKDRLKNNIQPSIMGLFEIIHEKHDGKDVLRLTIAGGLEKPYFLKKYGMTEKGCFLRIGSACEPMPKEMIESLYGKRVRNTIGRMESPRRDLTFAQLKIYYDARRLKLNDSFMKNLELLTPDDRPNYAAYLLADENGSSLQVAKYAGKDRVELIENRDYGRCSIVKALKSVLDRVDVENTVFTKIGYPLREERELIDSTAMREAVINAVVHNDYSYGAVPKVEFFADRAEVTSMGGLPYGVTEADFFGGCSVPRNKEIMRVFRDLEIVEHLGSGVPRILKAYGRDAFEIRDSYIRIAFRFKTVLSEKTVGETAGKTVGKTSEKLSEKTSEKISAEAVGEKEGEKEGKKEGEKEGGKLSKNRRQIIDAMRNDPFVTHLMLAGMLEMTPANVDRNIKYLKDHGWIKRVGPDKGGHWEVIGEDAK